VYFFLSPAKSRLTPIPSGSQWAVLCEKVKAVEEKEKGASQESSSSKSPKAQGALIIFE
jgi:hypothetical protein